MNKIREKNNIKIKQTEVPLTKRIKYAIISCRLKKQDENVQIDMWEGI
jgi:hypothetical protein